MRPVVVENVAQVGRFVTLNVSVLPLESAAVGVKLYAAPATTVAGGVPLIVGATLAGAATVMAKPGSDVVAVPSVTEMTMPVKLPTLPAAGVPLRRPVLVLKLAQDGRFEME